MSSESDVEPIRSDQEQVEANETVILAFGHGKVSVKERGAREMKTRPKKKGKSRSAEEPEGVEEKTDLRFGDPDHRHVG